MAVIHANGLGIVHVHACPDHGESCRDKDWSVQHNAAWRLAHKTEAIAGVNAQLALATLSTTERSALTASLASVNSL